MDISNLDTSKLTDNDNLEEFHEHVILSCKNMIRTAETALKTHPNLDKVVIMEHAPRFDSAHVDPLGLKPDLAKFANITLRQLWFISPMKNKLQIGNHRLNYISNNVSEYYQDTKSKRFDGVHMYSMKGKKAYTNSLIEILNDALPSPNQAT